MGRKLIVPIDCTAQAQQPSLLMTRVMLTGLNVTCVLLAAPARSSIFLVRSGPDEAPVREKIATQDDYKRVVGVREARYLCRADQPGDAVTSVHELEEGVEYVADYCECPDLPPSSACHVACSHLHAVL